MRDESLQERRWEIQRTCLHLKEGEQVDYRIDTLQEIFPGDLNRNWREHFEDNVAGSKTGETEIIEGRGFIRVRRPRIGPVREWCKCETPRYDSDRICMYCDMPEKGSK